ncbi:double-stranded RNA-specific editase Adar isoform X2 [Contarinia nasturtii]|uniref:double-stranded RNA-specific editase Adar isoform X2 n=1 Tax=Contarinia nasturtii TaxID=265458 RepID=UPI0012D38113|nr:double-stranded RNA-specific editase Adar isoform X2 [Contarinia nasturtii]
MILEKEPPSPPRQKPPLIYISFDNDMTSNGNDEVNQQNKSPNGVSQKKCGGSMQSLCTLRKSNRNNKANMGLKRRNVDPVVAGIPKKKLKANNGVTCAQQPKNTVAMLNELRQGLVYNLEAQTGPVHAPIFTMTVEVDGEKYVGQGRSKKLARIQAAEAALRSFIQFKDGTALSPVKSANTMDFTSDDHMDNNDTNKAAANKKQTPEKGPVMLLYELFNDVQIDCVSSDGVQHSRFKMVATVNNQKFEGTGPSKKLAKNAAAKAALATLCDISYSPMQMKSTETAPVESNKKQSYELPQTFADGIGKLVLEQFAEATVNIENYSRRKVLAGIVMTENLDLKTAKVIAVTTGTKCINGEYMSISGTSLNDSHAEIVARRCLMDFCYSQLELHTNASTAKDSIFVRPSQPDQLYKLRDGIKFHLFINTAPCGDARIFSPHETEIGVDKHPNRKARGQLRTKIESGEGTIPVKSSDGIQTWDGVMQGQRLLTMSCSDKIARWNVVGVQGALLSSIVQPIYLYSVVLGSLLHPDHMYRAVCGRIETSIQGLPPPYFLNKPKFALVTSTETRNQIKAPNFGINWTFSQRTVEVVNSLTGKTVNNKVSRLTKQVFFTRFANLIKQLPNLRGPRSIAGDYRETKQTARDYQIAKRELFDAFRREDLGSWLKKPIEQDNFGLPK